MRGLMCWCYLFHMPVFVMLSGYLGASSSMSSCKFAGRLLPPYITCQVLYSLVFVVFLRTEEQYLRAFSLSLMVPFYGLWYLIALVQWRQLHHLVSLTRWPLSTTVLLSLAAGFSELDYFLSGSRVFVFLPFYSFGHLSSPHSSSHTSTLLRRPSTWITRLLASTVLLLSLGVSATRPTSALILAVDVMFASGSNDSDIEKAGGCSDPNESSTRSLVQLPHHSHITSTSLSSLI